MKNAESAATIHALPAWKAFVVQFSRETGQSPAYFQAVSNTSAADIGRASIRPRSCSQTCKTSLKMHQTPP